MEAWYCPHGGRGSHHVSVCVPSAPGTKGWLLLCKQQGSFSRSPCEPASGTTHAPQEPPASGLRGERLVGPASPGGSHTCTCTQDRLMTRRSLPLLSWPLGLGHPAPHPGDSALPKECCHHVPRGNGHVEEEEVTFSSAQWPPPHRSHSRRSRSSSNSSQ